MTLSLRSTAFGLAACFCVVAGASPASAEPAPDAAHVAIVPAGAVSVDDVESARADLQPGLLLSPIEESAVGAIDLDGGVIVVPEQPEDGVVLSSPTGETVTVDLPAAERMDSAHELSDGTVVYPAEDFASSVAVTASGLQMTTTIADADAPTRFDYDLQLGEGQRLERAGRGAVVLDERGEVVVAIGEPWAKDASGADVPTWYEVSGSTLVQVVDHTAPGVSYPVVADPIWLAPWIVRCLIGIGLNGAQIAQIASKGSPLAIWAAFGWAAVRCVMGR